MIWHRALPWPWPVWNLDWGEKRLGWEGTISIRKVSQQAENLKENHDNEGGREEMMRGMGKRASRGSGELGLELGVGGWTGWEHWQCTGNADEFSFMKFDFEVPMGHSVPLPHKWVVNMGLGCWRNMELRVWRLGHLLGNYGRSWKTEKKGSCFLLSKGIKGGILRNLNMTG